MELLVVLAVMGVMMGLIGFSLGGGGNELGAANENFWGWFKARAQSALSGRETRLLYGMILKMKINIITTSKS